ncbi:MAG: four helix bundle protein [Candidatus Peribacteraceae bacterium]|nr:four helix bundle protein [Candidatus Peribacteraceae bacterium]
MPLLIRTIRKICRQKNVEKDFAFVDQITRSARSVSANIAEGFESMTVAEFITFLGYSKRSAGETRSHLYDALDENYIDQTAFNTLAEQTRKICRMIAGLIHYLQSVDQKKKRTSATHVPETKNQ